MFRRTRRARPVQVRPSLEVLDDRCLLSHSGMLHHMPMMSAAHQHHAASKEATAGRFRQTNLVSDLAGVAQVQDPNLVNPWGISESSGSPFWISDNNAGVSTLYNVPGANNMPVSINPLVVSIPMPGDPLGASGTPTGTVFNLDGGFTVSGVDTNGNPITAAAVFLFATEDGTLVGWNPAVNPKGFDPAKAGTYATIAVDNSGNNFTEPDPAKHVYGLPCQGRAP
jgi:hypothetical protein